MRLNKLSIEDVDLVNKFVLVRVDFNVPMDKQGNITNDQRIRAALPTINYILDKNPKKMILMSHLGRPNGQINEKYSLKPIQARLSKLLAESNRKDAKVEFIKEWMNDTKDSIDIKYRDSNIVLFENLRFHIEEEGSSKDVNGNKIKATSEDVYKFREKLSEFADVYVNDAFGTAHRAHSSMVGVKCDQRVCGFLMKKELDYFSKVLESPKRPLLAILGGAKIADKIPLIENLLDKVDGMIIGGGMSFTFKNILDNMSIGNSLFDREGSRIVNKLMEKAKEKGVKIYLPVDFVIADSFSNDAKTECVTQEQGIKDGWMGLDCGKKSVQIFDQVIQESNTVLWNGPAGVFEFDNFAVGTKSILDSIVNSTKKKNAISIIGGGDTATAVAKYNMEDCISHVSTGGGASLELLEGKELPGVKALSDKN